MPYTGKPSYGCARCKERHKKVSMRSPTDLLIESGLLSRQLENLPINEDEC